MAKHRLLGVARVALLLRTACGGEGDTKASAAPSADLRRFSETEALGRFNNSPSMNGTGISDHVVGLPGTRSRQDVPRHRQGRGQGRDAVPVDQPR